MARKRRKAEAAKQRKVAEEKRRLDEERRRLCEETKRREQLEREETRAAAERKAAEAKRREELEKTKKETHKALESALQSRKAILTHTGDELIKLPQNCDWLIQVYNRERGLVAQFVVERREMWWEARSYVEKPGLLWNYTLRCLPLIPVGKVWLVLQGMSAEKLRAFEADHDVAMIVQTAGDQFSILVIAPVLDDQEKTDKAQWELMAYWTRHYECGVMPHGYASKPPSHGPYLPDWILEGLPLPGLPVAGESYIVRSKLARIIVCHRTKIEMAMTLERLAQERQMAEENRPFCIDKRAMRRKQAAAATALLNDDKTAQSKLRVDALQRGQTAPTRPESSAEKVLPAYPDQAAPPARRRAPTTQSAQGQNEGRSVTRGDAPPEESPLAPDEIDQEQTKSPQRDTGRSL